MPKNNFELLSEEKKDAIIDSARELFSEHAYSEVSMELLVEKMSIPIATFYRYFKDKEDLFITMLNWRLDYSNLSEDFIRNPRKDAEEIFDRRLIHTIRNAPQEVLHKLYFESAERNMTRSVYLKELLRVKYEGDLREEIDPDLIAYMYATTMYNLQMYFKVMGMTSFEDVELCGKIIDNFYHSFFRYGIIKPDCEKKQ